MEHLAADVERRLLSACLTVPAVLRRVMAEITPEEITIPAHRAIYDVMVATAEAGREYDDVTVLARIVEREIDTAEAAEALRLAMAVYAPPDAWAEYADLVRREAMWTRTRRAGAWLTTAVDRRDPGLREQAMDLLTKRQGGGWEESGESLFRDVTDRLEGKRGTYLATPFGRLNHALGGGLVPGEVTVVGGWTSHAKSVFVNQAADGVADKGGDALYLTNEMRRDEVALRTMAGHGGPSFPSLRAGSVTGDQWGKLIQAQDEMKLKIVNAHARTCEEVCSFIGARRPDLAVIDLFNRLPRVSGTGTQELDEQVNRICDVAARSNAHVLLVCQLNRSRLSQSKEFPHPNLGDLRDTGSLGTHPANVLFTYLTADDEGIREGYVEVAKARNGEVGVTVPVTLNPGRMRLIQTL